jgi:hypothetical protein
VYLLIQGRFSGVIVSPDLESVFSANWSVSINCREAPSLLELPDKIGDCETIILGMVRKVSDAGISKLYHYERFNPVRLREALTTNRVRFSDPSRFNDPWDCSPMYVMDDVITPECVITWAAFLLRNPSEVLTHEQIRRLEQFSPLDHIQFLEDTIRKTTEHSREFTFSMWRIYCLTPDPASILMWAHYADSHQGVCLEFDTTVPVIAEARAVVYAETRPLIRWQMLSDSAQMTMAMLLTKAQQWAYEREFRILCRNGDLDQEPTATLCKTNGDFLELPSDAISRVIVGRRGEFDAVKQLVHDCRPELKVHQAGIAEREYKVIIPPEYWP